MLPSSRRWRFPFPTDAPGADFPPEAENQTRQNQKDTYIETNGSRTRQTFRIQDHKGDERSCRCPRAPQDDGQPQPDAQHRVADARQDVADTPAEPEERSSGESSGAELDAAQAFGAVRQTSNNGNTT